MSFFKNIMAAGALAVSALAAQAGQAPKYIFYYIGDGLGMGPVMAAQTYNRVVLGNDEPLLMMQFPTVAWCQTWSASSTTTDSAAAGTALSTGTKTGNGMLGVAPDSTAVTSVAARLHDMGWGVGITTSVSADDATPGAFYAHVPNRGMSYEIDCEAARCGYEFIAGAGLRGLTGDKHDEIVALMEQNGVRMLYGKAGAEAALDSRRVCLLNSETGNVWNVGYTIDSVADRLTLPLIAETCLAHLEKYSPEHFFMMVEGGNIDHALHGNDGGAAIKEIINFNEAIETALEFYAAHPEETLVIVTADHDTGGSSLLYSSGTGLRYIDYQKVSKEKFSEYCKSLLDNNTAYSWDDMKQYLRDNLGLFGPVPVDDSDTASLRSKFDTTFALRDSADQHTLYANFNAFAVEVFRVFNKAIGIGFTTTGHSGNPVPVYAIGCGAERFTGFTDNTDIPARIRAITHSDD